MWTEELGLRTIERQHGLPEGILEAIIYVESRGNSNSVGDGGRSDGLFQIMGVSAGRELQNKAAHYRQYGDFRNFRAGVDPAMDAQAAATMFNLNRDWYVRADGERAGVIGRDVTGFVARLTTGYNAGGPAIGASGIDAAFSAIYWHKNDNGVRTSPGYLPLVITYLRHSGYEETADQLTNEVLALPASEVNHARFREALAYAEREHRSAIQRINRDATPEALASIAARREHREILQDSDIVREAQQALGFTGSHIDGVWGRGTQRAFVASGFDTNHDGLISRAELNVFSNPAQRALRQEHRDITRSADLVRTIQRELGFTGKDVDGVWGPNTQRAYREHEGCHIGFTADGLISRAELATLTAPPTPPREESRNPLRDFVGSLFGRS